VDDDGPLHRFVDQKTLSGRYAFRRVSNLSIQGRPNEDLNKQWLYNALAIVAVATFVFGLQFIYHYFDMTISAHYSSYSDWLDSMLITVVFGSGMLGTLVAVFPWRVLEKSSLGRRAKELLL